MKSYASLQGFWLMTAVILSFPATPLWGATVHIAPWPDDPTRVQVEGDPEPTTLQAVLGDSHGGDTVELQAGTYLVNLEVPPEVNLVGAPGTTPEKVILDGSGCVPSAAGACSTLIYEHLETDPSEQAGGLLSGVTVTGGRGSPDPSDPWDQPFGGGIRLHQARLSLSQVIIKDNDAYRGGGLAAIDSVVQAEQVEVFSNRASYGGGILTSMGQVELQDVHIHDNVALDDGGGLLSSSAADFRGLLLERNQAGRDGGGGHLGSVFGVSLQVFDIQVYDNTAGDDGGGLYLASVDSGLIEQAVLIGNRGGSGAGGVLNSGWRLRDSELAFNHAATRGGGLMVLGTTSATDCHIHDNRVQVERDSQSFGGGLSLVGVASFVGKRLRIERNLAAVGGGVEAAWVEFVLDGCLVADNQALLAGGGLWSREVDGQLLNTTLAGNQALSGGGIQAIDDGPILNSVIIAENRSLGPTNSVLYRPFGTNSSAVVPSSDYGCFSSPHGGAGVWAMPWVDDWRSTFYGEGNLVTDPLFVCGSDPVCDDGDPYLLSADSPARDAGDPSTRRQDQDGSRNDMGAYGGPNGLSPLE